MRTGEEITLSRRSVLQLVCPSSYQCGTACVNQRTDSTLEQVTVGNTAGVRAETRGGPGEWGAVATLPRGRGGPGVTKAGADLQEAERA